MRTNQFVPSKCRRRKDPGANSNAIVGMGLKHSLRLPKTFFIP